MRKWLVRWLAIVIFFSIFPHTCSDLKMLLPAQHILLSEIVDDVSQGHDTFLDKKVKLRATVQDPVETLKRALSLKTNNPFVAFYIGDQRDPDAKKLQKYKSGETYTFTVKIFAIEWDKVNQQWGILATIIRLI